MRRSVWPVRDARSDRGRDGADGERPTRWTVTPVVVDEYDRALGLCYSNLESVARASVGTQHLLVPSSRPLDEGRRAETRRYSSASMWTVIATPPYGAQTSAGFCASTPRAAGVRSPVSLDSPRPSRLDASPHPRARTPSDCSTTPISSVQSSSRKPRSSSRPAAPRMPSGRPPTWCTSPWSP